MSDLIVRNGNKGFLGFIIDYVDSVITRYDDITLIRGRIKHKKPSDLKYDSTKITDIHYILHMENRDLHIYIYPHINICNILKLNRNNKNIITYYKSLVQKYKVFNDVFPYVFENIDVNVFVETKIHRKLINDGVRYLLFLSHYKYLPSLCADGFILNKYTINVANKNITRHIRNYLKKRKQMITTRMIKQMTTTKIIIKDGNVGFLASITNVISIKVSMFIDILYIRGRVKHKKPPKLMFHTTKITDIHYILKLEHVITSREAHIYLYPIINIKNILIIKKNKKNIITYYKSLIHKYKIFNEVIPYIFPDYNMHTDYRYNVFKETKIHRKNVFDGINYDLCSPHRGLLPSVCKGEFSINKYTINVANKNITKHIREYLKNNGHD